MYLGMDGTGVPVRRAELAGRAGKQADGSAKTREVKVVAVWAAATDEHGRELPEREVGSVTYSAAVESAAAQDTEPEPSPFAQRADREARRRGFDRAPRRVVLGDGAPWIWNIADELFPGAVQIVDLFHAKQHLWDVAKAIYGPGTDMAERWAKRRRDELDDGRLGALLRALRRHESRDEARRCVDYIRRNRHRMRYPAFRARGLCVGSGVLEAGCKNVVGTRFKRPGMHWSVAGVNAMAALRCCVLSKRLDDFWIRRKARLLTNLSYTRYPSSNARADQRIGSRKRAVLLRDHGARHLNSATCGGLVARMAFRSKDNRRLIRHWFFGFSIPHIEVGDLQRFRIPRLRPSLENEIADRVEEAACLRDQADELETGLAESADAEVQRFVSGA